MVGIIVCTHSKLADGFRQAVNMVIGNQKYFDSLGFFDGDDVIEFGGKIKNKIEEMGVDQAIIFTDLFGASPSNAAAIAMMAENAVVVTGVNLIMLIHALSQRGETTDTKELIEQITDKGKDNIKVLTKDTINNVRGENDD